MKRIADCNTEAYKRIKRTLAFALEDFLNQSRPKGIEILSKEECTDIENAIDEGEWWRLEKYIDKYTMSEDESTRRQMLAFFKQYHETGTYKSISDSTKFIEYLERHKDQKPDTEPCKEKIADGPPKHALESCRNNSYTFRVGDFVKYREEIYEIMDINNRAVQIGRWTTLKAFIRVKVVGIPRDPEETVTEIGPAGIQDLVKVDKVKVKEDFIKWDKSDDTMTSKIKLILCENFKIPTEEYCQYAIWLDSIRNRAHLAQKLNK